LAGGACRDLILGKTPHDWDLATSATPDEVEALFPTSKLVGQNFGVSLVKMNGEEFEVATFRTDSAYGDGRHPDSVKFTKDPKEDAQRRDFTVNALFMDRNGKIFDFVGGMDDLNNGILRTVGDPSDRFSEDCLRLLRAIRFSARLLFPLDERTFAAIVTNRAAVATLPPDRVQGELVKMLTGGNVDKALWMLDETGLLQYVMPELLEMHGVEQNPKWHPEGDVWNHTRKMLGMLQPECSLTLALGVLLHDVAKPATARRNPKTGHNQFIGHPEVGAEMAERILHRLRFSNEVTDKVKSLVSGHMNFFNSRKMSLAKKKKFVRQDNFLELLELNRFDSLGSNGDLTDHDFCQAFLESLPEEELHPERLLTGEDLLEMGFKAGPVFRTLLDLAEEAQLNGQATTKDEAKALVLQKGNQ
jgi:poly(A) polymerase